jgi:WD40 repeat protein
VWALEIGRVEGRDTLVAADSRGRIRIWDLDKRTPVGRPLSVNDKSVEALVLIERKGRTYLISGHADSSIRIWNLRTRKPIKALWGHGDYVRALAVGVIDRKRRVLASGGDDGTVRLWDLKTGDRIGDPFGHSGWVEAVGITRVAGQTIIISGGKDRHLCFWRPDGTLLTRIDLGAAINDIAVAPESRIIVASSKGLAVIRCGPALASVVGLVPARDT